MTRGQGRKKAFSERSRTSSRVRTGKKGRGKPRAKPTHQLSVTTRTQSTTGRFDIVTDEDGNPRKVFTSLN